MAEIYLKGSEKTNVLGVRQGLRRKFNFGPSWTELRMGFYGSAVAATGPNDVPVTESVALSSFADYMTFGLKDDSDTFPGQAGSTFVGVRGHFLTNASAVSGIAPNSGAFKGAGFDGVTEFNSSVFGISPIVIGNVSSAYACFYGLRIVINNRGTSAQTISIRLVQTEPGGTNFSKEALRTALNNDVPTSGAVDFDWNDGVNARAIPDCYWFRCPLFLNVVRLSAIRIIRYA